MCGDKSTTFYLCFYLLIRRLCSVGHVWRQVNHVLFVFLSFNRWLCRHVWRQVNHVLFVFLSLIRRLCIVGHVWRQVNHVLFVFLSFN